MKSNLMSPRCLTCDEDTDLLAYSNNIQPNQVLSTPTHNEQVIGDDVVEWNSVNSQSPTQAIGEATSRALLGSIPNDSPSTQRTEDHSEHNDSYPVGHVFLPELRTHARGQKRQIAERFSKIPTLPDPNLQQSFAETYSEYCYPWCQF